MPPPLALMLLSHMMTFPATLDNARVTDIATVFKSLLDSSIPRQFSSPCSICSICSICSTVFKSLLDMLDSFLPRPHHSHWRSFLSHMMTFPRHIGQLLEWPILRQFSSPCSIVRYLDSFQVPPRYARQFQVPPRYARQFSSPARYARQFLLDMLDSFWKRPPPLALTFLSHMMTFPATLDNTTPKNINTFRKIYRLKAPRHQSLKNCRTENRPINWLSSEPAKQF